MIIKKLLPIVFALGLTPVAQAQEQWPPVTQTAKPWTRWWWMGSAVDESGIKAQLQDLSNAGFGGTQVVPIYGAIGYEDKYINYLTPQWMNVLDYTVATSAGLNMGVDISVGTGWPIGGPQVSTQDAATKMVVETYSLKAGETLQEKIVMNDEKQKGIPGVFLSAVTAYDENGKATVITDKVLQDGTLQWSPKGGNWQLYALFVGKTGQKVKRAAAGGEGYTLDHFSDTALGNYFKAFDTAFGNSNHGVRSFFNDSYEVYGANWTPDFFTEFQKRKGYDLRLYIKDLVTKEGNEQIARVKSDYRETMSALMLENFTSKFTAWAHGKKSMNTNQAHGSPGNLLDLYALVDIPESETFGSTTFYIPGLRRASTDVQSVEPDIAVLKFASSAAHVTGKKLTSNETFTWLTEHFKTSWGQCKPEVEQVFLSGINHVFYHGTTYTPANAAFPGWLFYASTNFVPQNSLWPHLKGLNEYITRCQSILQSGEPDNEVLAYWPIYDTWANPKGLDMAFGIHQIDNWLCPTDFYTNTETLNSIGYSLDYSSDKMLTEAKVVDGQIKVTDKGAAYKVLVISKTKYMPVATLEHIIRLAKSGCTIVMQQFPEDVPGFNNLESNRNKLKDLIASITVQQKNNGIKEAVLGNGKIIITDTISQGLAYANINRETLTDRGLKFIKRKIDNGTYYYIVNHTPNKIDGLVALNTSAKSVVLLDPQTGKTGVGSFTAQKNNISVKLQLEPGEAIFVKALNELGNAKDKWNYHDKDANPIVLNNAWKLHFNNGGPVVPSDKTMKTLQPWTDFTDDVATQLFSGSATYTTIFKVERKNADDYVLQLDQLYESARVTVNGKDAGLVWSVPYKLSIGNYLKKGENTIEIEVRNLMANRIRYMDQNKLEWRKYHEINFVNIKYESFDASNWEVQPSGLGGTVTITPVNFLKD
ncbi:glycoside hydrolase [Flavobacterium zepuense]|uniref:Glycoside hydrolase n=1 Tax=Flavobacterium zepuense TaxID=2593302 RepID=A0A552V061_9FLAO|nr:glycosyl hydrolase [Flavobacterium zepuense]TRW23865.1 glycoside hydrolase [Flavobacterium zepuense]